MSDPVSLEQQRAWREAAGLLGKVDARRGLDPRVVSWPVPGAYEEYHSAWEAERARAMGETRAPSDVAERPSRKPPEARCTCTRKPQATVPGLLKEIEELRTEVGATNRRVNGVQDKLKDWHNWRAAFLTALEGVAKGERQ